MKLPLKPVHEVIPFIDDLFADMPLFTWPFAFRIEIGKGTGSKYPSYHLAGRLSGEYGGKTTAQFLEEIVSPRKGSIIPHRLPPSWP